MLRWFLRRRIAAFERAHDYDARYLHEILEASPRAVFAFGRAAALATYRRDVPLDAWFAARLVTIVAEDCGPCTQLGVTLAERAGISPAVVRAIIARDAAGMSADALLGFRFAEATLAHAQEADALREEILRRWGERALVSLAFVIATTRLYPTVKYALGHGKTCQRVTIGTDAVPVMRRAA